MKFRCFSIRAIAADGGEAELNAFCAYHRILTVEKQFVALGLDSYWALWVTYDEGGSRGGAANANPRRERVDYREVLSERDFKMFAELRRLRKTLAEQDGIPAYGVFTNEQLAAMVTSKASGLDNLASIEGIGSARLEKYGAAFVQRLGELQREEDGPNAPAAD